MVREHIFGKTLHVTKGIGKTIFGTELANTLGKTEILMRDNGKTEK